MVVYIVSVCERVCAFLSTIGPDSRRGLEIDLLGVGGGEQKLIWYENIFFFDKEKQM